MLTIESLRVIDSAGDNRLLWAGEIPNWAIHEGSPGNEHPVAHRSRAVRVRQDGGYGGVSIMWTEAFGECEVYAELSDNGMHLRVYLPDCPLEEPALDARICHGGLDVETIQHVEDSVHA